MAGSDPVYLFFFPNYFKIVINLCFFLRLCPFYCSNGDRKSWFNGVIWRWITKVDCLILHILVVLYSMLSMDSLTSINIRKEPTEIFSISQYAIQLISTLATIYLFWFKRIQLQRIVREIPKGSLCSCKLKTGFVLFVFLKSISFVIIRHYPVIYSMVTDNTIQVSYLHELLRLIQVRRPSNKVPLEEWEKILGFCGYIVVLYIYLIVAIFPVIILCGALALLEIQSRLLEMTEVNQFDYHHHFERDSARLPNVTVQTLTEFRDKYLSKIWAVLDGHTFTVYMATVYSAFVYNLGKGTSGTEKVMWLVDMFVAAVTLAICAKSNVKAKSVSKVILLSVPRIVRVGKEEEDLQMTSAEVDFVVNFSKCGPLGDITFGSLGQRFSMALQLGIIMLQLPLIAPQI